MNFFEQELNKVMRTCNNLKDVKYTGNICIGRVDGDVRARIEFVYKGVVGNYDSIKVTVINRKEGVIDKVTLYLGDILGSKKVDNPNFKNGIVPHIWRYDTNDKWDWYVYHPIAKDYGLIAQHIDAYLAAFL